ncbi:hypothetical protein BDW42DRAFT_166576 [Aspergillus taichungensis]|uniref:Uncharacterized protein n=1 Tax=Aspergillus taichungensis TaxID=482145 RepID=A0A2J5HYK0_9EURO|nr:hypothetical protein BDW42DRAFT_166576 [Aspergillus taichungensis]
MQLTNTLLTIMAAALVVSAAPPPKPDHNDIEARWDCPNGWTTCGECNGTSCHIAFWNSECDVGKCTAQSGGGDGKLCGVRDGNVECPGRG